MKRVIAIDGPAGSGKSTVSRAVAAALGLPNLETGAMYRALTWAVLQAGIDPADAEAVAGLAEKVQIEVGAGDAGGGLRVDGEAVAGVLRSPEVTAAVSAVSSVPRARAVLVAAQQRWIDECRGAVVEGRDIGTVVAPAAALKVFLVASVEERARRRHGEAAGPDEAGAGLPATLADIRRRDALDSGRAESPLKPADDAVVLDTTGRSVDEVVAEIVERYRIAVGR